MKTSTRLPILTAMIFAAALPTARAATKTYFGADNGVWVANGNWNPAVTPVTIDDVFLGSHSAGTTDLHVTYNETASVPLTSVTLNSTAIGGFMIVNQTSAGTNLNTITLNVGTTVPSNTWNQSAGFSSASTLNLGVGVNSTGNSYNLSGTGQLNGNMNVGVSGSGVFTQTGGLRGISAGNNTLGVNAGSSGTYNLSGGTLDAGSSGFQVGQNGTGLFTQVGGTATIGFLNVGTQSGTGTYNMSGGTLDTGLGGIEVGGSSGTAAFNLSNGTATVKNFNNNTSVVVGLNGTFNLLTAGTLNANIVVNGGGLFNLQNGGTVDADLVNQQTTARVTVNTGGLFALQGGTFTLAPTIVLGGGTFRLNGHSLTATSLSGPSGILESAAGNAVLTLGSGTGNFTGTIRDGASSILSVIVNGGQHTFSGSNTFTGSTTVSSGTLVAGSAAGFSPASAFVVNGGVAMANGFNVAVPSLSGTGGTLDVGSASFTVGSNSISTTFSGQISGSGIFDKVGNGQLTLNGGGSFSGQITVHAGSLRNTASNGLPPNATVTLSTLGTALNINASQALSGLNGGSLTSVNFSGVATTLSITGATGNSNYSGAFTGIGTLDKTGSGNFTVGNGPADTVSGNTDTGLTFRVSAGTLTLNKADGTNAAAGPVTLFGGSLQFQSGNQIADNSPVTINGGTFNLAALNETVGNLAGSGGSVAQSGGTLTVTQTSAATFSGALIGTGAFVKTGAADLTLTGTGSYGGSITASTGRLILQGQVGGSVITALGGGTVQFNNATATLGGKTIQASLGGAAEYIGATVNNGFLRGPGTHTILSGGGASSFTSVTTFNSTVLTQNGAATFTNFTNGGTLNNNAAATFDGGTNASSGVINVASTLNTKDFTSNGVINVPNGGTVSNTVSNLVLGGGSRTFIGSVATPGGTISTATGTSIELNGGLLVNNGTQTGVLNINFGGLAKGSGLFGAVSVTDGGKFSPGNSPGTATVAGLTFASGGSYQFELNSANATPGNGIDFVNDLGALNISAGITSNSVFTIALITLDSANQPAPLTDFDSSLPYSFTLATAAGGITGFAANEFTVDTSAFANSLQGGNFSVAQRGGDLVLNFSPSTVPEPTTCVLLVGGLGLLGLRRTRRARN